MSVTFQLRPIPEIVKKRNFSKAQAYVDSEALRLCEPYVPMLTGALVKSGQSGTVVGSGLVRYTAPYARYQYYGRVMIGKPPKQAANKPLNYTKTVHPQAGALWFERMKFDHKGEILRGAAKITGGKAK